MPIPDPAAMTTTRAPGRRLVLALALLLAGSSAAGAAPVPTGFAPVPDGRVAFFTFGRRTTRLPVVVVNGGPGFSHAYLTESGVWQRIARDRLVVMYDQRGTGASADLRAGATYGTADQAADLDAVRGTLGLDRFVLAGHSYGGYLGLAYVLRHPEHVARLILSDAPGPVLPHAPILLTDVFPDRFAPATRPESAEADVRLHLLSYFVSRAKARRYAAHLGEFGYDAAVDDAVSSGLRGADFTDRLRDVRMPTLVLNGRFDVDVPPITAWRMARAIPNARCVFFQASGHFPDVEEPALYRETIRAFLDAP